MKEEANSISVVVPVYNSVDVLFLLVERLKKTLENITNHYEIILVDDGSEDESWHIIKNIFKQYSCIKAFQLMRNYGQHNALLAGIQNASFDIIVTIDDDLQYAPEDIPKLLTTLTQGYDVVYGKPVIRRHSILYNAASRLAKKLILRLPNATIAAHTSAFRAFYRNVADGLINFSGAQLNIDTILTWSVSRYTHVLVEHHPRYKGKTNYSVQKRIRFGFNAFVGYSTIPLYFSTIAGSMALMVSFIMTMVLLVFPSNIKGYINSFSIELFFLGGIQLLTVGILGHYISRLHYRAMGRPAYVVRNTLENTDRLT